jgi:hypothetical protein
VTDDTRRDRWRVGMPAAVRQPPPSAAGRLLPVVCYGRGAVTLDRHYSVAITPIAIIGAGIRVGRGRVM